MRMSRFDWSDCVVKNLVDGVCSVVQFERSRNDDIRTLHALDKFFWLVYMPVLLYSSGELKQRILRFVFLNFPFVCQNTSVGLKLDGPRCTIGYCYIGHLLGD